jgi:hypothetical protein
MSRALTVITEQPSAGGGEPRTDAKPAASVVDAQVAGQTGARKGLKGGAPVLDAARTAYLDAEWRGEGDRRLPAGTLKAVVL